MKAKLEVGAELDLLSKDELDTSLQKGFSDFGRLLSAGIRYKKTTVSNLQGSTLGNSYVGGVSELQDLGPHPGFLWSVKNITYFNFPTAGVDVLANGFNPGDVLFADINGANARGTTVISSNALILYPGNIFYLGFLGAVGSTGAAMNIFYEEVKLEDIGKL